MKKIWIIFLFPFVCFATELFRVGTTSGYAPFVSIDEKGAYVGFDIDVAGELAKKLGKTLEIKDFGSMPGLMLALKQGKVDVLIWAISITDSRKMAMEMVHYQGETVSEMPILFWKNIPAGISTLADLKTAKVAVEAGSYQESVLLRYPQLRLTNLGQISDAILALKYGKAAAVCIDDALFSSLKEQYPELARLKVPLSTEECTHGYGVCINRSNTELAVKIRKAIEEMKKEGTIAALEKKWGFK